jgi:SagB-type dehydrogenase family enzyme
MENTIGKEFIRMTKYANLEPSAQSQGVPMPPIELPLPKGAEVLPLPDGKSLNLPPLDLAQLIEKRQSLRRYPETPLTLAELAYLLWGTQGIKTISEKQITRRVVPSAGARHAFETFLLINRVEGLEPGLYRYLAVEHQLAHLPAPQDFNAILTHACLSQAHIANSAVTFIWVADVQRMVWRYCQRGYRYLYLDAGHVCQNLYLLAESIGCGVCAIGAFDDNLVDAALDLDGEHQFALYLATLGRREQDS